MFKLLSCPACGGGLHPESIEASETEIIAGFLSCVICAKRYEIINDIPILTEPASS